MNVLHRHNRLICCLLFVASVLTGANFISSAEETDPGQDTRYERVVVKVSVTEFNIEGRRTAILDAHAQAVKLWLESHLLKVDPSTVRYCIDRLEEYVLTSEVLKETSLAQRAELEVEVFIDGDRMRFDVASLLFPKRKYRSSALILIGQQFMDEPYSTRLDDVGTAMLSRLFYENGFDQKSQAELDTVLQHDEIVRILRSGSVDGARMARALKMDVVVLGEVRTGEVDENLPNGRIKAFVDVFVVRASDGAVLDRVEEVAIVSGVDRVMASNIAASDAMFKVQQRILVAAALGMLNETPSRWTHCVIRGQNIKPLSDDIVFYLESKKEIESVQLLQPNRNDLIFDLVISVKISHFVEAVGKTAGDVFWMEPVSVVGGGELIFDFHVRE